MIVVEYSRSQRAFHVDTLENVIKNNLKMYLIHKEDNLPYSNDYQIIGVFKSYDDASEFIKKLGDVK